MCRKLYAAGAATILTIFACVFILVPHAQAQTTDPAQVAIQYATAQLGKPYVWGAAGPDSFDCSGLTQQAYAAAGIDIPKFSGDQESSIPHVSMDQIQPGDILWHPGHVALYIGNGQDIEARTHTEPVEYYPSSGRFVEAMRPSLMVNTAPTAAPPTQTPVITSSIVSIIVAEKTQAITSSVLTGLAALI